MKSEAYAYAKWILITFNNFKKTEKTERTHTHTKNLLSQSSESYDLQPQSTFMPVLISDLFSVEGNYS